MKGAMTRTSEKTGKASGLHNTLVYMRQHWQLYVIFMLPAVLLTVIFRYIPMGGVLIAFTEYNPIRGILGSEWVGFSHFTRFLSSPDFMRYLMNTLKLSIFGLLWGFPAPILLAFLLNRILSSGIKQKIQLVLYPENPQTPAGLQPCRAWQIPPAGSSSIPAQCPDYSRSNSPK